MASGNKKNSKNIAPATTKSQYIKLIKKGQFLYRKNQYAEALQHLNKAWNYDATDPNVMVIVADCLFKLGNVNAALDLMIHAVEQQPNDAGIAGTLGNAAMDMNAFEIAQKFHRHYISLKPDDPVGYNNLASALREDGKLEEAIELLQDVIPLFPDAEMLWNTIGSIVSFRDGPDKAIIFYEESLKLNPDNTYVLNNVAQAYGATGDMEKAENTIRKAILSNPDETSPHLFLSSILFRKQKLQEAWEEYSLRFNEQYIPSTIKRNRIPYWKGEDLTNKKIFVFGEQGVGDEILFCWCYKDLINQAKEVAITCEHRLVSLFQSSFPEAKVGRYEHRINPNLDERFLYFPDFTVQDYDYQCSAGDIARYFWNEYSDIVENSSPILSPDAEKIKHWQKEVSKLPHDISIGFAWRSGIKFANRSHHYTEIDNWLPLLNMSNVNYVNVQYGDCDQELKDLETRTGVKVHQFKDLDLKDDFEGTTAMMNALDLVIGPASAPTMQSQMAGINTWFLLSAQSWWSFGDEFPRWRKNARILPKDIDLTWPEHMENCGKDLEKWLKAKRKEKALK